MYQFNAGTTGISAPSSRQSFLMNNIKSAWHHNNIFGRIKQGFDVILTRYKMGRDIR
jgi:hypothetical protein